MKRNIVVFLFITIVLCGNFASCKKYPLKLVAEDRMVNILTELYLLEGVYSLPDYARRMTTEDEKAAYRKEIFERYGVTESRFDSTMEYCVKNPDMGLRIYDSVYARLTRYEGEVFASKNIAQMVKDTADISIDKYTTTSVGKKQNFSFNVDREELEFTEHGKGNVRARKKLYKGDVLYLFPVKDSLMEEASDYGLFVRYHNSRVELAKISIDEGSSKLCMMLELTDNPKEIYGYVYNTDSLFRSKKDAKLVRRLKQVSMIKVIRESEKR